MHNHKNYINTNKSLYLDMEKKNYILANIKIPMEINEDGNFETLPNHMTILFEKLHELPSPNENDYNNEYIKNTIKSLLCIENGVQTEKRMTIMIHDLENRKKRNHKKTITFKNKPFSMHRFTSKNYSAFDLGEPGVPPKVGDKGVDLY